MSKRSFLGFNHSFSRKPSRNQNQIQRQTANLVPKTEELKWVFDKFDTNRDGKISRQEYKAAVGQLGKAVGEAEVAQSFKAVDVDGDGFIDFEEFKEMMRNSGEGQGTKGELEAAFRVYDVDGNGKISAEELREVMRRMGERWSLEACKRMIRGVDGDGDGFIDMDEFVNMMTRTMKVV